MATNGNYDGLTSVDQFGTFKSDSDVPVTLAEQLRGSLRTVSNLAERDAIPARKLDNGMLIYAEDSTLIFVSGTAYLAGDEVYFDGKYYKVKSGQEVETTETDNPDVNTTDWELVGGTGSAPTDPNPKYFSYSGGTRNSNTGIMAGGEFGEASLGGGGGAGITFDNKGVYGLGDIVLYAGTNLELYEVTATDGLDGRLTTLTNPESDTTNWKVLTLSDTVKWDGSGLVDGDGNALTSGFLREAQTQATNNLGVVPAKRFNNLESYSAGDIVTYNSVLYTRQAVSAEDDNISEWDKNTTYADGDVVKSSNWRFLSIQDDNLNNYPDDNASFWISNPYAEANVDFGDNKRWFRYSAQGNVVINPTVSSPFTYLRTMGIDGVDYTLVTNSNIDDFSPEGISSLRTESLFAYTRIRVGKHYPSFDVNVVFDSPNFLNGDSDQNSGTFPRNRTIRFAADDPNKNALSGGMGKGNGDDDKYLRFYPRSYNSSKSLAAGSIANQIQRNTLVQTTSIRFVSDQATITNDAGVGLLWSMNGVVDPKGTGTVIFTNPIANLSIVEHISGSPRFVDGVNNGPGGYSFSNSNSSTINLPAPEHLFKYGDVHRHDNGDVWLCKVPYVTGNDAVYPPYSSTTSGGVITEVYPDCRRYLPGTYPGRTSNNLSTYWRYVGVVEL